MGLRGLAVSTTMTFKSVCFELFFENVCGLFQVGDSFLCAGGAPTRLNPAPDVSSVSINSAEISLDDDDDDHETSPDKHEGKGKHHD